MQRVLSKTQSSTISTSQQLKTSTHRLVSPSLAQRAKHLFLTNRLHVVAEGHAVMFDREAPFELRIQDPKQGPQEVGTLEAIRIKVLLLGGIGQNSIQNVKVELTSENDLFFHYTHTVDEDSFRQMQEAQKLMVDFQEYANIFIKMANSCIKEPHR